MGTFDKQIWTNQSLKLPMTNPHGATTTKIYVELHWGI